MKFGQETEWKPTSFVFANIQPMTSTNGRLLVPIICEYISLYKFVEQEVENETNEFYETDHEAEYGNEHASIREFVEEEEVKNPAEAIEVRVSP